MGEEQVLRGEEVSEVCANEGGNRFNVEEEDGVEGRDGHIWPRVRRAASGERGHDGTGRAHCVYCMCMSAVNAMCACVLRRLWAGMQRAKLTGNGEVW